MSELIVQRIEKHFMPKIKCNCNVHSINNPVCIIGNKLKKATIKAAFSMYHKAIMLLFLQYYLLLQ